MENKVLNSHRNDIIIKFKELLAKGSLPHAWLVTGPLNSDKSIFVQELVNIILHNRHTSASTDIIELNAVYNGAEEKKTHNISVDEIRQLTHFLRLTSAQNKHRVAIIHGAEYMNYNASNALLKILEEPGSKTIIFLITNAIGKILPTIRSRCMLITCQALEKSEFEEEVKKQLPMIGIAELNELYQFSHQNLELAIKIHGLDAYHIVKKALTCMNEPSHNLVLEVAEFAAINKDSWYITKHIVMNNIYTKLSQKSQNMYNISEQLLKKYESTLSMLIACEKSNLDKAKVIMTCLI